MVDVVAGVLKFNYFVICLIIHTYKFLTVVRKEKKEKQMFSFLIEEFPTVTHSVTCDFTDSNICGYLNIGTNPSQWLQYCSNKPGEYTALIYTCMILCAMYFYEVF